MRTFDAVLFDWSGTLVHDPLPRDRIRKALVTLDRKHDAALVAALLRDLDRARLEPDIEAALRDEDSSAALHRSSNVAWFERAGLDAELIGVLYDFDDEINNRPLYADAARTLSGLQRLGLQVAIVSDIHLDLRIMLAAQGVGAMIDAYVLSFEHGCPKPDPRMFRTALRA
jgi:FMN phosphatase YigB (HAD superfamily)